ncbi:hypothetical protein Poli38472_014798 [Pythium oligandrum]|uniref:Uncharacterized protein n=1 Tax=Pythium oligandrum TaxID=41045 RepID=A0A8K1CJ52_PYTOL|nr:hypothetical protein Poli38472_014798 [Pythium oligandrum]|eukprot:TMW63888.1 hypothetical protein Poli38472_014798 [Pythium oligandrum]
MGKATTGARGTTPSARASPVPKTAPTENPEANEPVPVAPEADAHRPPGSLLSLAELEAFENASSSSDKLLVLLDALHVQHYPANPRSTVWVDFCFGVLCFAREEARMTEYKTLVLLQIADQVFRFATTSQSDAMSSLQNVYTEFRELVRSHSIATDDSEGVERFNTSDVTQIVTFMGATFFRHLSAYQHVFQYARPTVVRLVEVEVESPLPPPPLNLATTIAQEPQAQ